MSGDALNRLNPIPERDGEPTSGAYTGDLPERIDRRYFTTTKFGAPFAFYTDARTRAAAFRDHGGRLSTDRNDPTIVRDLVEIARHRDWTIIAVRGQTDFRREVWITARAAGLEVRGYRPTERDLQDLQRRMPAIERAATPSPPERADAARTQVARARMRIVQTVVDARITDPAVRARIVASARARLADWLERGASLRDRDRAAKPERHR